MNLTASPAPAALSRCTEPQPRLTMPLVLCGLWCVLFFASLFSPPVLDDADGTHANAARQMALSGDWVTLRVNNVRYLEKAPLPYWLDAASFRVFGVNTFAAHLPQAVGVLLLMVLGVRWAREAFGERAALYTGLGVLTSAGVFLFTRVFLPDLLLSLFLAAALYCLQRALEANGPEAQAPEAKGADAPPDSTSAYAYSFWVALALAVLCKGLVAVVFVFATAVLYLALTGDSGRWRALKPLHGLLLFLVLAAPWHVLAGLRNPAGPGHHGFFWFYFVNEHVLRFLGRRIPRDYNKLPGYLYWSLHLVWLFPMSLFLPLLFVRGKRYWRELRYGGPEGHTTLLLALFSVLVLGFFSLSTNQEYYTFPAYLPLLMLLAAALAGAEQVKAIDEKAARARRWIGFAHGAFVVLGLGITAALGYGLWASRHIAFVPDIGDLLAHRAVGDYTLSMSSLFDLTGPSFAALRLPATIAMCAFAIGPALAWILRGQRRHVAATAAVALTSAVFLIAAHIALGRFAPMLSSKDFADRIQALERSGQIAPGSTLLLYGDQAYGSSIPFYLNRPLDRPALLVDGRSSSMLFGSTFPDAQPLFLTPAELLADWGTGDRKILFVPVKYREQVAQLLGARAILLKETSGKALLTDRPLAPEDALSGAVEGSRVPANQHRHS